MKIKDRNQTSKGIKYRFLFLYIIFLLLFLWGGFFYVKASSHELPDLTIENAVLEADRVTFTMRNIGTAGAYIKQVRFRWWDTDGNPVIVGFPEQVILWTSIQPLEAGESYFFDSSSITDIAPSINPASIRDKIKYPPGPAALLELNVDPGNSLVESNEDNNRVEIQRIHFPDLVIESATLVDNHLTLTISNEGSGYMQSIGIQLAWRSNLGGFLSYHTWSSPFPAGTFAPGVSQILSSDSNSAVQNFIANPPSQAQKLWLRVYSDTSAIESNMENNIVEVLPLTSDASGEELASEDEEIAAQEVEAEIMAEDEEGEPVEEVPAEEVPTEEIPDKKVPAEQTPSPAFEPKILPDNPLYFFKNIGREIKSFFTFNTEKKVNLRLRYATEKILEANKLADRGRGQSLASHLKNYEKDIVRSQNLIKKFREKNPKAAEKLIKKSLSAQLKHQILIGKFEKKATTETLNDIKKIRTQTIEHIRQIISSIDDSQAIKKIIETAITPNGSPFKSFRNLEVLKQVEEKVPAEAKDAIQKAQENSLRRFKNQFETLPEGYQRLFSGYIEKAGGDEVSYLKVLDNFKQEEIAESTANEMLQAKNKLILRIEDHFKDAIQKDPVLTKTMLQNLAGGTVENLRTIKTIERTINPAFKSYLDLIKKDALSGFQKNIGGISQSDQEKFIRETRDYLIAKEPPAFQDIDLTAPDLTVHATFPREYPKNRPVIGILNRGNVDTPVLNAPVNGVRLTWFDSNNTEIKSVVRSVKSLQKCVDKSCSNIFSSDSIDFRKDPDGDFPVNTARFRAEVDFAKFVKESNEDNNIEDTIDFKPDFGIGTALLTDTPQGRKFKVTIINWGDKQSPPLSAKNGIRVSWFAIKPAKPKSDTFTTTFGTEGGGIIIPLDRALEAGGYGYFEYLDEGIGKNFPDSDFNVVAEVDFGMEVDEELEKNNKVEFIHCAKITSPNCLVLGEKFEDLPDSLQSEVLSEVGSSDVSLRPAKHISAGLSSMFAQKDIMQIEILEDVRQNLSPEQQKIIEKTKESITKSITQKLRTVSAKNKDAVLRKITDDSPRSLEIIHKTFTDEKVRDTLLQRQLNTVKKRIEIIKDPAELKNLEEKLKETKDIKETIQRVSPEIIQKIKIRETEITTIAKPIISSFTANSLRITKGQSVILSWGVSNATSITLSPTRETLTVSGRKVVTPTITTTYTITATNSAGSTSASITITVR